MPYDLSKLLEKHDGSHENALKELAEQFDKEAASSKRARDARTDALKERDDLKTQLEGKETPEGSVFLSKADSERFKAFSALGEPGEVVQKLEAAKGATERLSQLERQGAVRDAAEVLGYKPSVLDRLAPDLSFTLEDVTLEGKTTKTVKARRGDVDVNLETEFADFLPSLRLEGAAQPAASSIKSLVPVGGSGANATPTDLVQSLKSSGNYSI